MAGSSRMPEERRRFLLLRRFTSVFARMRIGEGFRIGDAGIAALKDFFFSGDKEADDSAFAVAMIDDAAALWDLRVSTRSVRSVILSTRWSKHSLT